MSPALLLLPALLCAAPSPSSSKRPTDAALRKAFENNAHTLVEVSGGRRAGVGVVVGASGEIVTSVDHVALESATVRIGERVFPAKVLAANATLKFAVVSIASDASDVQLAAPAVRTDAVLSKGAWLVGITRVPAAVRKKSQAAQNPAELKPVAGQVVAARSLKSPFIVTDLPLPPGSPLFDPKGRLVAIVVERVGRIGSRALPVGAIQAQVVATGSQP